MRAGLWLRFSDGNEGLCAADPAALRCGQAVALRRQRRSEARRRYLLPDDKLGYHGRVQSAELLRTRYFVVRIDARTRIVYLWRSPEPFATLDEARRGWLSVVDALDRCGRLSRCLLTDLRDGPARNDPEYESIVREVVPRVHAGFLRNAVLVRMAAGALQIKRHARGDGIERLITSNEQEAIEYLKEVLIDSQ